MRILVTGGTGHLGHAIVSGLRGEGRRVRVLARRPGFHPGVEWIAGDLATGAGIDDAVAGVDAIVHAATNSPAARRGRLRVADLVHSPADVDLDGTRALLAAAEAAAVARFVHVSIAGLEHMKGLAYTRRKLEAEEIVRSSLIPSSIVRATGFYWLLERLFDGMAEQRVLAVPAHVRMAPVDSDEVAAFVVDGLLAGRTGAESFAGPETLTLVELLEKYLDARGRPRRIRRAPVPRRIQRALTAGSTAPGAPRGTTTWAQWLARRDAAGPAELPLAA